MGEIAVGHGAIGLIWIGLCRIRERTDNIGIIQEAEAGCVDLSVAVESSKGS
jgi:hypothetical protein